MSDIGVPELKTHVSEIVCKVKEGGKSYIIPLHGRPAAAIVPVEDAQAGRDSQASSSSWDELVQIGYQISQEWKSSQSSVEILSDMRR